MSIANRTIEWLVCHLSWLLCAALILGFLASDPGCWNLRYWQDLPRYNFEMTALALVLTPLLLAGDIDLSVGSVALLSSMVVGLWFESMHGPDHQRFAIAVAAGMAVGLGAGFVNGSLVVLGVPSFVATLAMRELYRGVAVGISAGRTIEFPEGLSGLWDKTIRGIPLPMYCLLALFAFLFVAVHWTWFGKRLLAHQRNPDATPARGLRFCCYSLVGLVAGGCGAASVMRQARAVPLAETNLELLAIAALVLGGVRITGGSGNVAGTVLGAITLAVVLAGLHNLPPSGREAIVGVMLLIVALGHEVVARRTAMQLRPGAVLPRGIG